MGSWGTGLFQNDTAADVKMVFADQLRRPIDVDTIVRRIVDQLGGGSDPGPEDSADISLALADLLHQYALDHPPTFAHARHLIEAGADLALKRDQGMSPRDLDKRGRVLAEALARWEQPHPKPKTRRAPPGPEPFLFEVGEVWAYPTMQHAARPFQVKEADPGGFAPDGWGVFAVADRWHAFDHRACYLFALAIAGGADGPTIETVRDAPLQECTFTMEGYAAPKIYPMIFEARPAKKTQGLKKWPATRLGTLPLDAAKVRALLPDATTQRYNANDPDGLAWLEDDLTVSSYHRAASNARTGLDWQIRPHGSLRIADLCRDR